MHSSDQQEWLHELYRMQYETNSVVSINGSLWINFIISVLWIFTIIFQMLCFNSCHFSIFINKQTWKQSILFQQTGLAVILGVFLTGCEFSVINLYTLIRTVSFLIFQYCFNIQWNIKSWKEFINFRFVFEERWIKEGNFQRLFDYKWICFMNSWQL